MFITDRIRRRTAKLRTNARINPAGYQIHIIICGAGSQGFDIIYLTAGKKAAGKNVFQRYKNRKIVYFFKILLKFVVFYSVSYYESNLIL